MTPPHRAHMAIMAQTKHESRSNPRHATSPDGRGEGDREAKFEDDGQGTSPEDDDSRRDTADAENGDGQHAASPNSDSPARKRRRSRKGLDKKFDCTFEGCGKSYSRAEHLYRHQLNHNAKIVFTCSFKGCGKTFVRLDLRSRHEERHTARGSAIGRRNSIVGQSPIADRPHTGIPHVHGSLSPESSRPATGFPSIPVLRPSAPYQSPQGSVSSPYTPITNTPPAAYATHLVANGADGGYVPDGGYPNMASHQAQVRRHSLAHSVAHAANIQPPQPPVPPPQYDVVASAPAYASQAQTVSYVAQQAGMPVSLPSSTYINSHVTPFSRPGGQPYAPPTTTAGYHEEVANQSSEMMMLDQMSIQATVPVFGNDGLSNKSPYAIPDDFVVYLFNPPGVASDMQRMDSMVQYQNSGYDDYQARYGAPYFPNEGLPPNYYASASHEIMAVNNLLDQNTPEATISEEKSQEIYDFIKERFQERNRPPVEKRRDCILEGDRADPEHLLSKRMMQAYIGAYWLHFSDQIPILHKPTFSPDKTPTLLLIAMMAIGAACLDRGKEPSNVRPGALVSNFLAWSLRFEVFMDDNFAPPSKLWIFQTLILLELYEKMLTTREMHERAHIHHATTITLMRRGRSLIGKSALESPPNPRSESSSSAAAGTTPDDWWNSWIANESTRRTAFAAFVVDSLHGTMFGHSTVMVAHEMRLPLPCDDSLWNATSAGDVARLEAKLAADNLKPASFLEGLKCTLNNQEVHTNSFGRTVLMAGLLSVAWHMHQRDLQINVLGSGALSAGGRDSWRSAITRAFDHWKMDYDKALLRTEPTRDPYRLSETKRTDDRQVFESRTVLLHLAHMATHADIVECQMFARAKRLLGRAISQQDLQHVQVRMRETWAPSPRGRNAAFYALKYLFTVLMPESTGGAPPQPGYEPNMPYSARDDLLLNRPWVLYYAALVLWSYGHALEGPSADTPLPSTHQEMVAGMRQYLLQYATVSSPEDLRHKGGISKNSAVLMVLRETFKLTRWELLHEAANLLHNCITLNTGGSVH